jgi:hypothetical protein
MLTVSHFKGKDDLFLKKPVLFTVLFKLCVGAEIVQIPLSHENGRIDVQYLKEKLGKH